MARKPQVTRTIQTTKVNVMCVDTTTADVTTKIVEVSGVYKDEKALLKEAKKLLETETIKVVSIVSFNTVENLYMMLEKDFIEHATILPSRSKTETL